MWLDFSREGQHLPHLVSTGVSVQSTLASQQPLNPHISSKQLPPSPCEKTERNKPLHTSSDTLIDATYSTFTRSWQHPAVRGHHCLLYWRPVTSFLPSNTLSVITIHQIHFPPPRPATGSCRTTGNSRKDIENRSRKFRIASIFPISFCVLLTIHQKNKTKTQKHKTKNVQWTWKQSPSSIPSLKSLRLWSRKYKALLLCSVWGLATLASDLTVVVSLLVTFSKSPVPPKMMKSWSWSTIVP